MNSRQYAVAAMVSLLPLSSCITDDSLDASVVLPTLAVEGGGVEVMPQFNFYLGQEAVLSPSVTYSGSGALTYRWQVGTYANGVKGELQDAGNGPTLRHRFSSGGSYYAHLTVTDGAVGRAADYQVNMNRTFEEGYLLSAVNADGGGNLTFVKILTAEEIEAGSGPVVMENAMERMNDAAEEDGLLGAVIAQANYPVSVTRLLVSTKRLCYFLDPNEFTIISTVDYEEVYSGFSATNFYAASQTPYVYDTISKRFVHLNITNQFPFEYQYFVDNKPEGIVPSKTYSNHGFQRESVVDYFLDYTNRRAAMFNAYGQSSYGTNFPSTTDMLGAGHRLVTAFAGLTQGYSNPSYVISATSDSVFLWSNTASDRYMRKTDFSKRSIAHAANVALPMRGARMHMSQTQSRMFYHIGNKVFVYLPGNDFALPTLDQPAIAFDEGEAVTCMEVRLSTDELLVATYSEARGRGSFYVYSCADVRTDNSASVAPKQAWRDCTGRVGSILYKPSVQ